MNSYEKILREVTPTDAQRKLRLTIDNSAVLTVSEKLTL